MDLLGWRILDKLNTLLDVGLETLDGGLEQLLLVFIGCAKDVVGFLSTRWL